MREILNRLLKRLPPGFLRFKREFLRRVKEDNVTATGAQLAYYLVLAFFPFLIFLLTLLPLTPLGDQESLASILDFLPPTAAELIGPLINDILQNRSGMLLSAALVLSLWSASSGMTNLLVAMDLAFDVENTRNILAKRLISLAFTLLLVVMILTTLAAQVFGSAIVDLLMQTVLPETFVRTGWDLARNLIPFAVLTLGFATLYRFGPGFPRTLRIRWRAALGGGLFAALLWTMSSGGFAYYVGNFANYANTYGSIGGLIVLLVWLYLSSVVIMLGAEATASFVSIQQSNSPSDQ